MTNYHFKIKLYIFRRYYCLNTLLYFNIYIQFGEKSRTFIYKESQMQTKYDFWFVSAKKGDYYKNKDHLRIAISKVVAFDLFFFPSYCLNACSLKSQFNKKTFVQNLMSVPIVLYCSSNTSFQRIPLSGKSFIQMSIYKYLLQMANDVF